MQTFANKAEVLFVLGENRMYWRDLKNCGLHFWRIKTIYCKQATHIVEEKTSMLRDIRSSL